MKNNNIVWENDKYGYFIDPRDQHKYKIVKIGSQIWMAENFAYKASDGCWIYDNDIYNKTIYGCLYSWETAKNVVPKGWHLPSKEEFEILLDNFAKRPTREEVNALIDKFGGKATEEQVKILLDNETGRTKLAFKSLRLNGNTDFNAIFSGYFEKSFYGKSHYVGFWSSTIDERTKQIWRLDLDNDNNKAILNIDRNFGLSIRCLLDK